MLAVSDTTPLNYLLQIGAVHLLPALYEEVCLPEAVLREMQHPKAPLAVRDFAAAPPGWVRIEVDQPISSPDLFALHPGEAQAIRVCELLKADFFLTDDKAARRVAEVRGLRIVTTLLILDTSADRGWVDFGVAAEALRRTNFRVDPLLIEQLLDKHSRPAR